MNNREVTQSLTKREREILSLLATGRTLTVIANDLHISQNTMKTHLKNLYKKMGADGLLNAFEKGKLEISDKYSFDLPPIQSASEWDQMVTEFLTNAEKFVATVAQTDDAHFNEPFIDEKYGTLLRNIEGVIEHSYYHLGQVSLINKMIQESKN